MKTRIVFILITLLCGAMASVQSARAATIMVTNTNDSGRGSLRQALAVANDGDTIDATGVSGTTLLTSGELQMNHNVTINGPGAGNLTVNGNATFRVFENFASNVTISGLTITNGLPPTGDNNGGGGILNHGGLTLTGTSVLSNNAGSSTTFNLFRGGGINSDGGGTLTVTDSVINNNQAGNSSSGNAGEGGGIFADSGTVTVSNSTISGNQAVNGGFKNNGAAGGIAMPGLNGPATLSVTNSVISGNSAESGGGILISGTLTVTNSVISGNSGFFSGGGIVAGGTVTVSNSTISGNSYFCDGGGIDFGGATLTVVNSTISGNGSPGGGDGGFGCGPEPHGGGGISAGGTATVINSTISGNHADLSGVGAGGGIFNRGNLTVTNSTISDNTASTLGGAVYNSSTANIGDTVLTGAAQIGETIFNDGGTVTSLGYNLASDNGGGMLTGPGDQINTDPLLGPLQDNGGPTFTHALLPGSPAINAGNLNFSPPPNYDQRGPGYPRVLNGRIDKGSFEVQAGSTPTPSPTPTATARPEPTPRVRPTPVPRP